MRAKVRMIQRRKRACFTLEAAQSIGIDNKVQWQNFERDEATELEIARKVNFSHATRAQEFLDLVCRDLLTDERRNDRCDSGVLRKRMGRDFHRRTLHEVRRLRLRFQQTQHFIAQYRIVRRCGCDERFARFGRLFERLLEQCVNLFPQLAVHFSYC